MSHLAETAGAAARRAGPLGFFGAVKTITGVAVLVEDRLGALEVGARVEIETDGGSLAAEVVGVTDGEAVCLPFGGVAGVRRGARVSFASPHGRVAPSSAWLGRVVDALGRPVDGKGPLAPGPVARDLRATPPPAATRGRLGKTVAFGVKALDVFCPARSGQRLGVFSGSGIGKSALLAMIARNTECDVAVIALIGERGREVRDFIEDSLGPEGLARSVIIVATSDEPAMMRREAAYLAMSVSEAFREQGAHVLCLMDSLTRVAAAQREIGLAAGEPPTSKGYTPSVFSLLPAILERAGPGRDRPGEGAITGVFTVLVEGDDHDEPIADAARAILDGHIVLSRKIAERGRFPSIDILKTVSRGADACLADDRLDLVRQARWLASVYDDVGEMVRIGAYRTGANEEVDRAVAFHPLLEGFLAQDSAQFADLDDAFDGIAKILSDQEISEE
ncbi:MAG: FliI/YscN family ATPase [Parvularculaceae bacterium]